MPKITSDDTLKMTVLTHDEATPPHLSERRIAQLQGAVGAAQRKRVSHTRDIIERAKEIN
jgi:hypothetical protein